MVLNLLKLYSVIIHIYLKISFKDFAENDICNKKLVDCGATAHIMYNIEKGCKIGTRFYCG